jgi:hypothetical protein
MLGGQQYQRRVDNRQNKEQIGAIFAAAASVLGGHYL